MYQVSIFNGGVETVIHYPSPDKGTPHVLSLPYKESLSKPDELSFSIPIMNPGYSLIQGLRTKVKVYDVRDNSVVFSGRVIPTKNMMATDGSTTKDVTCEGGLAYLNDTNTRRWNFTNKTPAEILSILLSEHNLKVDSERQIQLGVVEITQPITIDTNYETTLNAIITKLHNIIGGDLRVQERDGVLYLDYLIAQGADNGVEIRLGYNLKDMAQEYDPMDIVTRVIPLGYGEGVNQLGITSVNNGIDYLDNVDAITEYGVIEAVVTNKDIQYPDTLKLYGEFVLNEKKQPRITYEQNALDLSLLAGRQNERYELGDTLHTICEVLGIDVYSRVIERDRDLVNEPWNPKLTISTRSITLTNEINELKQRNLTLENAPQGSTYIDTFGYAENIDATHPFQLPIWLSPDILNVNRVRLHIDSQRFRAYEQGMAAGGAVTVSSEGGGSTTVSSSSGGGTTATSSAGGGQNTTSGASSSSTTSSGGDTVTSTNAAFGNEWGWLNTNEPAYDDTSTVEQLLAVYPGHFHTIDYDWFRHSHSVSIGSHTHGMDHTHDVSISDHDHSVTIPDHDHSVTIPDHSHSVYIPDHSHGLIYGIFEDTYPQNVFVKINGQEIAGPFGQDGKVFNVDLDLTSYIGTPGTTYNLEVTSARNGRVNVWVSVQAFIQAK